MKTMKKLLANALLACIAGYAAEIRISSEPALPTANQVANGSFDGSITGWSASNGNEARIAFDDAEGRFAAGCIRLAGEEGQQVCASRYIKFDKSIPKGGNLFLRFACKKVGTDFEKAAESVSFQLSMPDGKSKFIPVPNILIEDHDWAEYESHVILDEECVGGTLSLCYNDQIGTVYFDDIEMYTGRVSLKITVSGKALEHILVRSSIDGVVLSENASGNTFDRTLDVPAFGSYCVEVMEADGRKSSQLYPANYDANVPATEHVHPLTPIRRLIFAPNSSRAEQFQFELKEVLPDKSLAMLEFDTRLMIPAESTARGGLMGHCCALKVFVNGTQLTEKNMVHPEYVVIFANGRSGKMYGNNGYTLSYSTTICPLDIENSYCPVNIGDRNPFKMKLNVSGLLKAGTNVISFLNAYPTSPIYSFDVCVENARIEIK